jgi:rod shape-determining protein MreD
MIKKIILSTIILYMLTLLETSFFVHFNIFLWVPSTVLIYVILFNIIEDPKKHGGIYVSFIAGLFSDIFSSHFIGFYILIFLAVSIFLKLIFNRYVRTPFSKKN